MHDKRCFRHTCLSFSLSPSPSTATLLLHEPPSVFMCFKMFLLLKINFWIYSYSGQYLHYLFFCSLTPAIHMCTHKHTHTHFILLTHCKTTCLLSDMS